VTGDELGLCSVGLLHILSSRFPHVTKSARHDGATTFDDDGMFGGNERHYSGRSMQPESLTGLPYTLRVFLYASRTQK